MAIPLIPIILGALIVTGTYLTIMYPEILPEPLRPFFLTVRLFFELLGVSLFSQELVELRPVGILMLLPLMLGLVYLILRLIRGGG
jgi:hypothetical protein